MKSLVQVGSAETRMSGVLTARQRGGLAEIVERHSHQLIAFATEAGPFDILPSATPVEHIGA